MDLNKPGRMVSDTWSEQSKRFPNVELDECILMPNHFHAILFIGATTRVAPTTLGKIVGAFKSITTTQYIDGVENYGWPRFSGELWQRSYHDAIIRTNESLEQIREYIVNNPSQWDLDPENVSKNKILASA
jgi:putative transposase